MILNTLSTQTDISNLFTIIPKKLYKTQLFLNSNIKFTFSLGFWKASVNFLKALTSAYNNLNRYVIESRVNLFIFAIQNASNFPYIFESKDYNFYFAKVLFHHTSTCSYYKHAKILPFNYECSKLFIFYLVGTFFIYKSRRTT